MKRKKQFFQITDSEYDRYARAAWDRFVANPERATTTLRALADLDVRHALDVGCGAAHELLPLVTQRGTIGVGIDLVPETGHAARELFSAHAPRAHVRFVRASAEALPFTDGSFDVVICRLALPYTDNRRALGEMARVLRAGGYFLLKIHHARYYLRKCTDGLIALDTRSVVHALRVLTAGTVYYFTGWQPRVRITGGETFQTRGLLRRELERRGLTVLVELPDTNADTPSFLISKRTMIHER